ncbi:MAG: chemotaxis protein CheC [Deltaproteobacteria bacterium]|nr:chemotaxis protein CheC [Deltaproteobacteria bacterium]
MSRDWLFEYAVAGVKAAADSLASLLDAEPATRAPVCDKIDMSALPDKVFPENTGSIAVFADLVGAIQGEAGIAFRRGEADALVRALVPDADVEAFDTSAQSAMSEVGNIALSSAAGAIAELIGGVVIPSVPRLGANLSDVLLVDEICGDLGRMPVYVAEAEVNTPGNPLQLTFVWIPGD